MFRDNMPPPRSPAPANATMADVAAQAGVSLKSVSRVINNEPHVSPRLRARVEAAIAALAYVPDTAARSLAGARSFTIGIMFDNPSPNYTMKIVAGAYRACVARQYHLRIDNIDSAAGDEALAHQLDQIIRHSRSDGFVVTPPLADSPLVLDFLEARGIRYSRLAPLIEPARSPAVYIDDGNAAAELAQLLWDMGHRRFAIANGPAEHGAAVTRRAGFLSRLAALNPEGVVHEAYAGFDFEGGIAAGRELLSARRQPTAIFAANDDSAAGVMAACQQMGFSVPGDVSVCGFDDSWIALSVWPYLTTIRQPIDEMAEMAANMVIDRDQGVVQRQLPYALIARASTAPPK